MSDQNVAFDDALGESAFHRIAPTLEAIAPDDVERVVLPIDQVALIVLAWCAKLDRPEVRDRLALIPDTLWRPAALDRLRDGAWAAWYIHEQVRRDDTLRSNRRLSEDLDHASKTVRQRMLALATYLFDDHPVEGPEVAAIRKGSGHLDRASDLSRLANLYKRHRAHVALDPKNYREGDERDARRLAADILTTLGVHTADTWQALRARAWTQLSQDYEEVRRVVNFAFHHDDPLGLRATPSLFAALRSPSAATPTPTRAPEPPAE